MDNPLLDTTRFQGIFQVPVLLDVTLIGAGGIGALTAVGLGKMGIQDITVIDDDEVDGVNIATQFHRFSDVGISKVAAVTGLLNEFAGTPIITPVVGRVGKDVRLNRCGEVTISAVDSITARQNIWQAVLNAPYQPSWYIDARMAALEFQMFVVDMRDTAAVNDYSQKLWALNEEDVPEVACTMKATIFLSGLSMATIGSSVMKIIQGRETSRWFIHNIDSDFIYTIPLGAH